MKEALATLNHAVQQHQRDLDWCLSQRAELAIKVKRISRDLYHAKDQLKKLEKEYASE